MDPRRGLLRVTVVGALVLGLALMPGGSAAADLLPGVTSPSLPPVQVDVPPLTPANVAPRRTSTPPASTPADPQTTPAPPPTEPPPPSAPAPSPPAPTPPVPEPSPPAPPLPEPTDTAPPPTSEPVPSTSATEGLPLPTLPPLPVPSPTPNPEQPPPSPEATPTAAPSGPRPAPPPTAKPAPRAPKTPPRAGAVPTTDDPAHDYYPEVPFDPVTSPNAAQVQALYSVLKRIQVLQNTVATATARLAVRQKELTAAQAGLESARRERNAAGRRLYIEYTDKSPVPSSLTALGADPQERNAKEFDRLVRGLSGWEEQVGAARKAAITANADLTAARRDLATQLAVAAALRSTVAENARTAVTGQAAPGYTGGRLRWPVGGRLSSPFGTRYDPYYHVWQLHAGLDLAAPAGTPIRAAATGTVVRAGWFGGYGNYTCLAHGVVRGQRLTTCYAHQSRLLVKPGQRIGAGQVLGLVGTTGASTGPHLHFEVRLGGRPVDPRPWL